MSYSDYILTRYSVVCQVVGAKKIPRRVESTGGLPRKNELALFLSYHDARGFVSSAQRWDCPGQYEIPLIVSSISLVRVSIMVTIPHLCAAPRRPLALANALLCRSKRPKIPQQLQCTSYLRLIFFSPLLRSAHLVMAQHYTTLHYLSIGQTKKWPRMSLSGAARGK